MFLNNDHLKTYGIIAAAAVVLVVAAVADWRAFVKSGGHEEPARVAEREGVQAVVVARQWVLGSSPTYLFDGIGLSEGAVVASSDGSAYRASFAFESAHGGYGDRAGLVVTQAIVPHTIVVDVENGKVIRAITDEKYNEITGAVVE